MKLAAFFSGGKDSTYAIYDAKKSGHIIQVLFTILPKSDESHLLHFPNIEQTKIQSESKIQSGVPLTEIYNRVWLRIQILVK